MVSVLKIVDGRVQWQQPVQNGLITDDNERQTNGLHRGQEFIRGIYDGLTTGDDLTVFGDTDYNTYLEVHKTSECDKAMSEGKRAIDSPIVCEFRIARKVTMDSPWEYWIRGHGWTSSAS